MKSEGKRGKAEEKVGGSGPSRSAPSLKAYRGKADRGRSDPLGQDGARLEREGVTNRKKRQVTGNKATFVFFPREEKIFLSSR